MPLSDECIQHTSASPQILSDTILDISDSTKRHVSICRKWLNVKKVCNNEEEQKEGVCVCVHSHACAYMYLGMCICV